MIDIFQPSLEDIAILFGVAVVVIVIIVTTILPGGD